VEDLKRTVALLFKRKGKEAMSEKEFVFSASMDLRWFSPKEAQKLMDTAVAADVLQREGGEVRPNFDVSTVEVPMDFTPAKEVLQPPPQAPDMLDRILARVPEAGDDRELVARVNAIQERMNVTVEVAALLMALEEGANVADLLDEVEALLKGG
jgi:hypothetical protein